MTSSVYSNSEAGVQRGLEMLEEHRKRFRAAIAEYGEPTAILLNEMANMASLWRGVVCGVFGPDVVAKEAPEIITRMFGGLLAMRPDADHVKLAATLQEFCEGLAVHHPTNVKES